VYFRPSHLFSNEVIALRILGRDTKVIARISAPGSSPLVIFRERLLLFEQQSEERAALPPFQYSNLKGNGCSGE
jgi:hypothetical protein